MHPIPDSVTFAEKSGVQIYFYLRAFSYCSSRKIILNLTQKLKKTWDNAQKNQLWDISTMISNLRSPSTSLHPIHTSYVLYPWHTFSLLKEADVEWTFNPFCYYLYESYSAPWEEHAWPNLIFHF